jgi:multicomponent Na+:H+ antiporter subunit B
VRRSLIFRTTGPLLVALLALLSVFMLLRGHLAPGGGFVGGLLLAGAIAIQSLAEDTEAGRRMLRLDPRVLVGIGLLVAVISAVSGMVAGGGLLSPVHLGHVPGLGEIGSVLLFDIGVYLIVAGTATQILLSLAEAT